MGIDPSSDVSRCAENDLVFPAIDSTNADRDGSILRSIGECSDGDGTAVVNPRLAPRLLVDAPALAAGQRHRAAAEVGVGGDGIRQRAYNIAAVVAERPFPLGPAAG